MADHADDGDDNDVFIYMGGDQRVPQHVTHVRVHKSVKIIRYRAFQNCRLVSIEMHDGVEIIEFMVFYQCKSIIRIKLPGREGYRRGCIPKLYSAGGCRIRQQPGNN